MNDLQRMQVLQTQLSAVTMENAALKVTAAGQENADLKAAAAQAASKTVSEQNFIALIRRRADKLVAKGQIYDALILLKSIGG